MKNLVIGILAHVDAGKTTLSESFLYLSGAIKKPGRVDNKNAFLDNTELERARGITIFSKQAVFTWKDTEITLLDTPGHIDFSAEMERTLQALDYAVLVISGADGVQGHTLTLWRLLALHRIPTFVFVNKMDQNGCDRDSLFCSINDTFNGSLVDFGCFDKASAGDAFYEQLAMCDEALLDEFLDTGMISPSHIISAIKQRRVFPCFFGSALKMDGVDRLLDGIAEYTDMPAYPDRFMARVIKIARDEQDNRLTYMKITGGSLKARTLLGGINPSTGETWEEKVNQLRIYSGQKFQSVNEVSAGCVCAVTGLSQTYPGQGLGVEHADTLQCIQPVMSYELILPSDIDSRSAFLRLKKLEEEMPELHIIFREETGEIQVQIMGEVQLEVLKEIVFTRFGIPIVFGTGHILYKETITDTVEGVGHFEPLRHYAEVHLVLEPSERGSGLSFEADPCCMDILEKNWQRLILTHLEEKSHPGVLTGSPITDMRIRLVGGRAHKKHTEGGDFREATYRAVRQGLMEAHSILLEPYYDFTLELPEGYVGRAMTDIDKMCGSCRIVSAINGTCTLTGRAPMSAMKNYHKEVLAYTKGFGRFSCIVSGYDLCHDEARVIEAAAYNPDADINNPTGSVFCAHGAGFYVEWDKVKQHMHVDSYFSGNAADSPPSSAIKSTFSSEQWIATEEVDEILNRTAFANKNAKKVWKKTNIRPEYYAPVKPDTQKPKKPLQKYLLVDGYNIVFAWPDLKELAADSIDAARSSLLDCMCNFKAAIDSEVIVVFDAYRLEGHNTEYFDYNNIHVVFTKEKETADQYIEKFVHRHNTDYNVTVATSDGLEQIIIRGDGAVLLSASELKDEVDRTGSANYLRYREKQPIARNYLSEYMPKQKEADD